MAKRFIDTNIFRKSFMKNISVEAKLFYVYLFCDCDHCGIWQVEFEVAKVRLGLINLTEHDVINYFGDKIVVFDDGNKWFLPQFVLFQYGDLKANNKIHKSVIANLTKFNLIELLNTYDDTKHLPNTLQSVKDKDKEMDKEKNKEKYQNKDNAISEDLSGYQVLIDTSTPNNNKKPRKTKQGTDTSEHFKQFMQEYATFIENKGLPLMINGADGKALKAIISYLNSIDSVKQGDKKAIDIWKYILINWNKLSAWLQTQVQLRQINSQLPSIIEYLRNNGKQTNNQSSAQQLAEALRSAISNGSSL